MEISSFTGEYKFLSNFYNCMIVYDEIKYPSVLHAYQAQKTLDIELREYISKLHTANDAKQYGKGIKVRNDWYEISILVMYELVKLKFKTYDNLKDKLLLTGNANIIEGNTWGDTFWGVCNGIGLNNLGKILMLIREELKYE